ncbi:MAG: DegT/DnrJ/EryC1/StrS family aminotransferase [Trebonia sp.]
MCSSRGVLLVEDAAHALGAGHAGRPAGSFGDAAAFSFFPTKVVTTAARPPGPARDQPGRRRLREPPARRSPVPPACLVGTRPVPGGAGLCSPPLLPARVARQPFRADRAAMVP